MVEIRDREPRIGRTSRAYRALCFPLHTNNAIGAIPVYGHGHGAFCWWLHKRSRRPAFGQKICPDCRKELPVSKLLKKKLKELVGVSMIILKE